jgi:deoxyribodipyrimidine photolyase-related protein
MSDKTTVWVLGDQLNVRIGAMRAATPRTHRVLMVESALKNGSRPWHRQRLHFIVSSMRHFAEELRADGFEVDYVRADTMTQGLALHRAAHPGSRVVATAPNSLAATALLARLGVETEETNQFLTPRGEFAAWAATRKSLKMEDFYRRQRTRLGYLMDGDQPAGGQWNFDHENREPPPRDGSNPWGDPLSDPLDDIDLDVFASLPPNCTGADPVGWWSTTRTGAFRRLRHFVEHLLPVFGPHEDAMLAGNWHLAHSMLSPYLNNGLLMPADVCDAVQWAYDNGRIPIASAEGFVRQIIGWREYVNGLYWMWMPGYLDKNELGAVRPLPRAFVDPSSTRMRCVSLCAGAVQERGWAHHIQRLMVLGNLALIAGVDPRAMNDWMWESFVDGAEWVMVPNVIGMSLHADGGMMATKPYASGGAYIDRMSDYCKGCSYDRKKRTGDDACPFTTLYWDFLLRHADRFVRNPRMGTQVRAAQKLADVDAVRDRAADVLQMLDAGRL